MSHDWFCFDCDVMVSKKSRQFLECNYCRRVFHRKCCLEFNVTKDYKCRYCVTVETEHTNGFINEEQSVDRKRMNRLIGFLLDFIKIRMKNKFEELDIKFEGRDFIYIFKKMNLSIMREKVDRQEYTSLPEFDDDFYLYTHNLVISQIQFNHTNNRQNFEDLRLFLMKELIELKKCVDCYERANDKALHESNKEWICLPCNPPHTPVFVKQRNSPYWPAKVIGQTSDNKKAEVCFFEAEKVKDKSKSTPPTLKKCEVKAIEMKEIRDKDILNEIKGKQRLVKPMDLLVKYLELSTNKNQYLETIKFIKENHLSLKTSGRSDKSMEDSIDRSIESVVQSSRKAKTLSSKKTPKSRSKKDSNSVTKLTAQPNTRYKRGEAAQASNSSTRSSSPNSIPILPNMFDKELSDSVDSLSDKMPNMEIGDQPPPPLDLIGKTITTESPNTTKRRSGRIAALITPQKTETKNKNEVKSANKGTKHRARNTSVEAMEVDGEETNQSIETNSEYNRNDSESEMSERPQTSHSVLITDDNTQQNTVLDLTHKNSGSSAQKSSIVIQLNSNTETKKLDSSHSSKMTGISKFNAIFKNIFSNSIL